MEGYITLSDIEYFGVRKNYIWNALHLFKSGKSHSWENMKDPKDRRKVLIKYDTIPETTKRKYGMPETFEDYEYFLIRKTAKENLERKEKEIVVNSHSLKFLQSFGCLYFALKFLIKKLCKIAKNCKFRV